ncbi:MAG: hypothetical protein IBX48_01270 [Thiomicrospira sp.]|uniref:hypothetical protein n=1 Tax=Thiomicrospira sp. TaxID=935 RepID=UPI001A049269|nr:hypothetical protein [Thiomicrospira sp.]MBE0492950.1 hypothetical protein [Thiomicrospira sp.]
MKKLDLGFSTQYFQRLILWPFLGLVFSLILSWVVYDQFLKRVSLQTQQVYLQEQQVNQLMRQVGQLKQEVSVKQAHQLRFEAIKQQGFDQPIDRVLWTDSLNQVSQAWLLSGLSVQFEAEKRLNASDVKQLPVSRPIFYSHKMMLNLRLQTDADYLKLMDWLRQNVSPFFLVEHCDIQLQRTGVGVEMSLKPEQGNVVMRCGLQLLRAEPASFDPKEWR